LLIFLLKHPNHLEVKVMFFDKLIESMDLFNIFFYIILTFKSYFCNMSPPIITILILLAYYKISALH